jgi:acetylornithine aminotransferase
MIENLAERAHDLGEYSIHTLRNRLKDVSNVLEVRGKGLMIGIECDRPVTEWVTVMRERGLLVLSAGPNVIRILPALTITQELLEQGIQIICETLEGH